MRIECGEKGRRQGLEEEVVEWEDGEEEFKPCGQTKTYIRDVNVGFCLQIHADPNFFKDCSSASATCQLLTYWSAATYKNLQEKGNKARGRHSLMWQDGMKQEDMVEEDGKECARENEKRDGGSSIARQIHKRIRNNASTTAVKCSKGGKFQDCLMRGGYSMILATSLKNGGESTRT
ncbi:hypothetical protein PoB_006694600 [Plakobranchus ocellatus]|uniref:Uncharacterized protein n=1 Tax=Plakobranchus ocellatus TaxID=259542 RepID=A0AAV4D929_9GAST|nr:hypothetical protein PoB_006694600 [Plakobranchus ocellatus]